MKKGFLFFLAPVTAFPITIGAGPASVANARGCGTNSYINSRGNCVHRPVRSSKAPAGASARCRDGT